MYGFSPRRTAQIIRPKAIHWFSAQRVAAARQQNQGQQNQGRQSPGTNPSQQGQSQQPESPDPTSQTQSQQAQGQTANQSQQSHNQQSRSQTAANQSQQSQSHQSQGQQGQGQSQQGQSQQSQKGQSQTAGQGQQSGTQQSGIRFTLGIQPDPVPCPNPVDGVALFDGLKAALGCYLALPEGALEAIVLWVLFTHTFDAAEVSPRLAILSPIRECGKTIALWILNRLARKAMLTSNVSAAVVFRVIDQDRPTLLMDEADTYLDQRGDEFRGILNSGHTRDAAAVWRTEGDKFKPKAFSTWAPIAIAKIGKLPDTLASRSIIIVMRRKRADESVVRYRPNRDGPSLDELARKCARWAKDNLQKLKGGDPMNAGAPLTFTITRSKAARSRECRWFDRLLVLGAPTCAGIVDIAAQPVSICLPVHTPTKGKRRRSVVRCRSMPPMVGTSHADCGWIAL
jgi:hypothetical protein